MDKYIPVKHKIQNMDGHHNTRETKYTIIETQITILNNTIIKNINRQINTSET